MPYKLRVYGLTDVGLVRKNNEDLWAELTDLQTYILADGMGGHQAGEVAASQAIIALCDYLKKMLNDPTSSFTLEEMRSEIVYAIQRVNAKVYQMGYNDRELKGMGTTLCCLHFHSEGIIYAHVGDSRIYKFQAGKLKQITEDHSLAREMVVNGQLEEQDITEFSYKNIITKAIGTEPYVDPTVEIDEVEKGALYMMCSDGLSDHLKREEIETILANDGALKNLTHELINAAKDKGGYDNITVVLIKVEEANQDEKDLSR